MKKLINVVLGICALAMLFICYRSIADQQNFDREVAQRENDVKTRLLEIRDAQNAYKEQHPDIGFCADWDTLIEWVKVAKLPTIIKLGVLTEEQMEKGLTCPRGTRQRCRDCRQRTSELPSRHHMGFSHRFSLLQQPCPR